MSGKIDQLSATAGQIRAQIQDQLDSLSFATQLWQIFRAIVSGTLKSLSHKLECSVSTIMRAIDAKIQEFFLTSLQLDDITMAREHE